MGPLYGILDRKKEDDVSVSNHNIGYFRQLDIIKESNHTLKKNQSYWRLDSFIQLLEELEFCAKKESNLINFFNKKILETTITHKLVKHKYTIFFFFFFYLLKKKKPIDMMEM